MDTFEIQNVVKMDALVENIFLDVFSADNLPTKKIEQDVWFLIVNCCPSHLPGLHWLALFGDCGNIEFFDSYGGSPRAYDFIIDFLQNQRPDVVQYNAIRLQELDSYACGYFVLLFGFMRSRRWILSQIVDCLRAIKFQNSTTFDIFLKQLVLILYSK